MRRFLVLFCAGAIVLGGAGTSQAQQDAIRQILARLAKVERDNRLLKRQNRQLRRRLFRVERRSARKAKGNLSAKVTREIKAEVTHQINQAVPKKVKAAVGATVKTAVETAVRQLPRSRGLPPKSRITAAPGFFTKAKFLYLFSAYSKQYAVAKNPGTAGLGDGRVHRVSPRSGPAFRVSLGRRFQDGWSVAGAWFRFQSRGTATAFSPSATLSQANEVLSIGAGGVCDANCKLIRAELSLTTDIADLDLRKSLQVSPRFSLDIHGGPSFLHVNERAKYLNFSAANTLTTVERRFQFLGAGLKFGSQGEWQVGRGLYLFAGASGALYFGRSRHRVQQISLGALTHDISDDRLQMVPATHMMAGLRYTRWIKGIQMTLSLGYELFYIFGPNQRRTSDDFREGHAVDEGRIALHGVSFRMRFDF